ncbi:MAG: putative Ig domain-containing protein [Blastocatellia bacterium]|nr:putative Ig domain-containing protein [Blastocatellia bacterium]
MKNLFRLFIATVLLTAFLCPMAKTSAAGSSWTRLESLPATSPNAPAGARPNHPVRLEAARLPLLFEENQGQAPADFRFLARGSKYLLGLTPEGATLTLRPTAKKGNPNHAATTLTMRLEGASRQPVISGREPLSAQTHYFGGTNQNNWKTNISNYAKVAYKAVYPGIDVMYYGNQNQLEYDFIVAPHSNPHTIQMAFAGAKYLLVNQDGDLVIGTAGGKLKHQHPVAYQEKNGVRIPVSCSFALNHNRVGFQVGQYDPLLPLVIDPTLTYSTFFGGTGDENDPDYAGVATNASGDVYIVGTTVGNFVPEPLPKPTNNPAFQPICNGTDAFIAKFTNNNGTPTLAYTAYLGGQGSDEGRAIAVDAQGNAYVTGNTNSSDFPRSSNPSPLTPNSFGNARTKGFVAKISSTGSSLLYSTFLGGTTDDNEGNSIAVDSDGIIYVTGSTTSDSYPTVNGIPNQAPKFRQFTISKINPTVSGNGALLYSTLYGGTGAEIGHGIALDTNKNIYMVGTSFSNDVPLVNELQTFSGLEEAFVMKLTLTNQQQPGSYNLTFASYLGGRGIDRGNAIAVDQAGYVYVTGETDSNKSDSNPPFPVTSNAFQGIYNDTFGSQDAFLTKYQPNFSGLAYSTLFGDARVNGGTGNNAGSERGLGLAVDTCGRAYLTGQTDSTTLPITNNAFQKNNGGNGDVFVAVFDTTVQNGQNANALVYSTFLRGTSGEQPRGLALTPGAARVFMTGLTVSTDFPVTQNAVQPTFGGGGAGNKDAFLSKVDLTDIISGCCPNITVNPQTLPSPTVGVGYNQTVSATGGTGPYNFAVKTGALPGGLSLNAGTGVVSGTPNAANTFTFTIEATDANGCKGTRQYAVTVANGGGGGCQNTTITLNPQTLNNGTVGVAFNQTVTATGGTGPYNYAVTAGALPGGLSLNAGTGVVSGTPNTANTFSFTIEATDANGCKGNRSYSVTIANGGGGGGCQNTTILVNPQTLSNGTVGIAYNQAVSAVGGAGSYTFAVTAGVLPGGLTLNASTGVISGTPNAANVWPFTIEATDSNGCKGSRSYTVTISSNGGGGCQNTLITVDPVNLLNGILNTAYSQTVYAGGGTAPYTFTIINGTLPAGLSLNSSTGVISGTPTVVTTTIFVVQAQDANGCTGVRQFSLTINQTAFCPTITLFPTTLPNGAPGTGYSQLIDAWNGTGPYRYAVTGGTLPPGLSLNPNNGLISGTPAAANSFTFTIEATDSNGCKGTRTYTVSIGGGGGGGCPAIAIGPGSLATGTLGASFTQTFTATGAAGPFTFTVAAGSLPNGLSLNAATGVVSGTLNNAGTFSFTIRATNQAGCSGSQSYSLLVVSNEPCPTLAINPPTIDNGAVSIPYSQLISASQGNGPYTYQVSSGILPAGLLLDATTGLLSGVPSQDGSFTFTVRATDARGCNNSQVYSLMIASNGCPAIVFRPSTLPSASLGVPYQVRIAVYTGTKSHGEFTITKGVLPSGIQMSKDGLFFGTPRLSGIFRFTVMANVDGCLGSQDYTLLVQEGNIFGFNNVTQPFDWWQDITGFLPLAILPETAWHTSWWEEVIG